MLQINSTGFKSRIDIASLSYGLYCRGLTLETLFVIIIVTVLVPNLFILDWYISRIIIIDDMQMVNVWLKSCLKEPDPKERWIISRVEMAFKSLLDGWLCSDLPFLSISSELWVFAGRRRSGRIFFRVCCDLLLAEFIIVASTPRVSLCVHCVNRELPV